MFSHGVQCSSSNVLVFNPVRQTTPKHTLKERLSRGSSGSGWVQQRKHRKKVRPEACVRRPLPVEEDRTLPISYKHNEPKEVMIHGL